MSITEAQAAERRYADLLDWGCNPRAAWDEVVAHRGAEIIPMNGVIGAQFADGSYTSYRNGLKVGIKRISTDSAKKHHASPRHGEISGKSERI